jgi:hypothetical protein
VDCGAEHDSGPISNLNGEVSIPRFWTRGCNDQCVCRPICISAPLPMRTHFWTPACPRPWCRVLISCGVTSAVQGSAHRQLIGRRSIMQGDPTN